MKKENKIIGCIIFVISFFVILLLITFNFMIETTSKRIYLTIDKIKLEAQEIIEGIQCEFTYKDLHYKGICTEELIEDTAELIAFDYRNDLLELCMQNPYAYRYELCEDMGAIR